MHLSSPPFCGGAHAAKSLVFCRLFTALLSDDGCNRILFTSSFIYTSLSCLLTQGKLRVQQTPEFEGSIQWPKENNSRQNTKDLAA
jgi:hypothetical protein